MKRGRGRPVEHAEKTARVLELLVLGWTVRAIAVEVGCGKSTVWRIKSGR